MRIRKIVFCNTERILKTGMESNSVEQMIVNLSDPVNIFTDYITINTGENRMISSVHTNEEEDGNNKNCHHYSPSMSGKAPGMYP